MGSRHDELIVYLATKRAVLLAGSCQCHGSSAVRFGSTFSLIAFSQNVASYCPRPRLCSQSPTFMMAAQLGVSGGICVCGWS
jgi:hypothetical protein